MKRLLQMLFPGDEGWLWRRACFVSAIVNEIWCLAHATLRADAALVQAHGVVLLGALAAYSAAAVADDHSKRTNGGAA